jgi:formylglycine-generating enzyme required for sulfatase activity
VTAKIYTFETVRMNEQGAIVERIPGEAEYFVEDLGNGVTLAMVYVPGGEFLMGVPDGEAESYDDEKPQHRVTVPEFCLGKFAVTQAQYAAIAGENPSRFKGEQRPVERVSWHDAVAFCKALADRTGRHYRLPSEAEWECACRAGTSTPFAFGPTITPDLAHYGGDLGQTAEVGQFPPNGLGLYDLHGNVWEWCADGWHDTYDGAPSDGTAWTEGGNQDRRVIRGGAWYLTPRNCRSAYRFNDTPVNRNYFIGFRVVCSPPRAS